MMDKVIIDNKIPPINLFNIDHIYDLVLRIRLDHESNVNSDKEEGSLK